MSDQRPVVFGRNLVVGTLVEDLNPYDQLTDQAALFATAAAVDISSTSAVDLAGATPGTGARTVKVVGLDADFKPVTETLSMNGQTKVVGTQTFKCVFYAEVATAGTGRTNAGIIHIVKSTTGGTYTTGTPATLTSALIKVLAGDGKQGSGAYCTPAGTIYGVESLLLGASVQPGVFRILSETGSVQSLDYEIDFNIGTYDLPVGNLWWPEKTYIRLQAAAQGASGKYSARLTLKRLV